MLSKNERVPRKLFGELVKSKSYLSSTHFSLRSAPASSTRISVSVSKKISKSAVVRNRVRRRVYSAIHELIPKLPKKLFFLSAKSGAENTKVETLKKELAELLIKR